MFATFKPEEGPRGTGVLVCDTPDGTFTPWSDGMVTPVDWSSLDGTFYVEGGRPYMVFCHEWVQTGNGEIWAVELSRDLSHSVGDPFMLFKASDNPNVSELDGREGCYVTDGPFLYHDGEKLRMIWSSFYLGRYLVLEAETDSIHGKWIHGGSRFDFDGGHAMLFTSLEGKRTVSLHSPNLAGLERATFYDFE